MSEHPHSTLRLVATCTQVARVDPFTGAEQEELLVAYALAGSPLSFRHSVVLALKDKRLGERLCRAIEAGAVVKGIETHKDNEGHDYLTSTFMIRMRCANADLFLNSALRDFAGKGVGTTP